MAKSLSQAEKLVAEQMLAIVEWASEHPKLWHSLGKEAATLQAAELLEKRGVIEIASHSNQYRLKAQK